MDAESGHSNIYRDEAVAHYLGDNESPGLLRTAFFWTRTMMWVSAALAAGALAFVVFTEIAVVERIDGRVQMDIAEPLALIRLPLRHRHLLGVGDIVPLELPGLPGEPGRISGRVAAVGKAARDGTVEVRLVAIPGDLPVGVDARVDLPLRAVVTVRRQRLYEHLAGWVWP